MSGEDKARSLYLVSRMVTKAHRVKDRSSEVINDVESLSSCFFENTLLILKESSKSRRLRNIELLICFHLREFWKANREDKFSSDRIIFTDHLKTTMGYRKIWYNILAVLRKATETEVILEVSYR